MSSSMLLAPALVGGVGIVFAVAFYFRVKLQEAGNDLMNSIAGYVREGAMAFLFREYKVLAVYIVIVGAALGMSM